MKKLMMLMSMIVAVSAGACVDGADPTVPITAPPVASDGAPLTAEQRAALEANPELKEMRAQLAAGGQVVSLDEARVFEQGDKQGIICPVNGQGGQPGQFSQLTVQQRAGGEPTLALERNEDYRAPTGDLRDQLLAAAGRQCEPNWFPLRIVAQYCEWATACWFGDATYNVVQHVRTCCEPGRGCWEEFRNFSERDGCGC